MQPLIRTVALLMVFAFATAVPGATMDDEAWLPSAGHGPGAAGSFWVTDVYIMNPTEDPVEVEITFLPLGTDNSDTEGEVFEIPAEGLLTLEDVTSSLSPEESAFGALHIEVVEEDEDDEELRIVVREQDDPEDFFEDDVPLMVFARIYDRGGDGTRGQALEGYTSSAAIGAGTDLPLTHVLGVTQNDEFRSNWFGINVSEDELGEATTAEVLVELLDDSSEVLASMTYTIPPRSPIFEQVSDLSSNLENGVLRFTMQHGAAIFGASKIDNESNDGTTLESFWNAVDPGESEFTDTFNTGLCTWSDVGFNPYFPLQPGLSLTLQAEEDGEIEEVILSVTDQTRVVDGVTTRVVTETESEGGELTEISYNYFASCVETGDVYYFGEEVDMYEDGQVVSHEGAWLAGENGAYAGIIMPGGTPLIGARYYQEVAPDAALDRAEHVAVGQTIETEAGTFGNCLIVMDSSAFEPAAGGDPKAYCPGIGLVRDEDLELVDMTLPN